MATDPARVINHDYRAALVCDLTALCVAADDFVAVGDPDDGWIVLPPRRFIQPAQWTLLNLNGREEAGEALRVFPAMVTDGAGGEAEVKGVAAL